MFRLFVKQRGHFDRPQIDDVGIISANIVEDKTQNANSKFVLERVTTGSIGDVVAVYDNYGKFIYFGVISKIDKNSIATSQFESIFDDKHLIVPQTSANQKAFFNSKTVSEVTDMYIKSKEQGYQSIANTTTNLTPTYTGLVDEDVKDSFKGITNFVYDAGLEHMPYPTERKEINLEDFLYDQFKQYSRIIKPKIKFANVETLPNGYTKLKYIQSSGSEYIDLGVNIQNDDRLEFDAMFPTSSTRWAGYFGSYEFSLGVRNNYNDGSYTIHNGTFARIGDNVLDSRTKVILDGNTLTFGTYSGTLTRYSSTHSALLFAYKTSSHQAYSGRMATMRLYRLTISGTNSCDFVPAKRDSDGAIGVYDKLNDIFIAGVGDLAYEEESQSGFDLALINPSGVIDFNGDILDYSSKNLFDSWESITNIKIEKESFENNTCAVYSDDGATFRGAFTILNDGTIQQITSGVNVLNRIGSNRTSFVFDSDNSLADLARAELPNILYNHQISFDISFLGEYKFNDFLLGMPIKFYESGNLYSSILTRWEYRLDIKSDTVLNAKFTLGNVRNDLTSKVNLIKKGRK